MGYLEVYSPTRDEVITSALRKLGVVRQGGVPTAEQLNEGQQALNMILKELSALFKHQWLMSTYNVVITNSVSTYDLSNVTPLIDRLISGFYTNSVGIKSSVEVVDINKFYSLPPLSSSLITTIYLDTTFNSATQSWVFTLNVYPTPTGLSTEVLKILYRGQMKVPNAALDKLQLPYNMYRYVIMRLAADIAHEYGININEIGILEKKAMGALDILLLDYKATSVDMRDHRFDVRYRQTGAIDANTEN